MSPLVVVTDSDLPSAGAEERLLAAAGLDARRAGCRSEQDVIDRCAGADALIVQWAPVSARVLDALPGLRMISRLGIGYDMIDVDAATARGVAVANTPDYCIEEVACHTLALVLDQARGVAVLDRAVRSGRWAAPASYPDAARPSTTTVAVIGYGRIGVRVAASLRAIGFRVLVHDRYVSERRIRSAGLVPATLAEALGGADIVTLHVPLTVDTQHMIDAAAIAAMRPGARLVNTCRGGLVDESALAHALQAGHLAGAGLDVFEAEPPPAESPLRELAMVTLSPHAAWYSAAALADLPVLATRQVIDFLAGKPVAAIVNPGYAEASRAAG
ncbi:MAG TPA: C-terminal binding protein [Gaiellales bacterium]|jgi:D-3-phosphoglycerate dehydrogenase